MVSELKLVTAKVMSTQHVECSTSLENVFSMITCGILHEKLGFSKSRLESTDFNFFSVVVLVRLPISISPESSDEAFRVLQDDFMKSMLGFINE